MNFQALKGMIVSLTKNFKCSECSSGVSEENVEIVGAAGNTINLDVTCPNCSKHSMIKSEVMSIDLTGKLSKNQLDSLKKNIGNKKINNIMIKDEQIVELNKELKKEEVNVSDLFGEDKKED